MGGTGSDGGELSPAAPMRARPIGSRVTLWVLLEANRLVIVGVLLGGMFVALVGIGMVDAAGLRTALTNGSPVQTLFQAFVTAIITGVTLVVAINQLVLAQELGAVGDQRQRMEGALEFRADVEEVLAHAVSPAEPAAFTRALLEAIADRAGALAAVVDAECEPAVADDVRAFTDDLAESATAVSGKLSGAEFGEFEVVSAALDFEYSRRLHEARRLRARHGDALSAEADAAVEDVLEPLSLFGPTREHLKTLYFQWALIDLSRLIVYSAFPALVVSVAMVVYADDPGSLAGTTLGVDNAVLVVSAAATVATAPFALLAAYILRIATIAQRTLAIGPFVLRETAGAGEPEDE